MKHNIKKTKKIVIWAVIITAVVVVGANYLITNDLLNSEPLIYQRESTELDNALTSTFIKPLTFEEKIEALKTEVRDKIMFGESQNHVIEEGEVFFTFDPSSSILAECRRVGGRMNLDCLSFGPLQFKVSTIIYYENKLNGIDVSESEAIIIAHDIKRASKLFDDIVYGENGGIWNWSVAYQDVVYYETVIPIVRKLIK